MKEESLTLQILEYLRTYNFPAWRTHDTRHHPVEAGIADINAVLPSGRFFACEVKKPGGTTNKIREQLQIEWLARVKIRGAIVCRAESIEDVEISLRAEGVIL